MTRDTRETFEQRSSEGNVLQSSQTLSNFVWEQIFTTDRSGLDQKHLFERSSFQSSKSGTDVITSIPAWAVTHTRLIEEVPQEQRQERPMPARQTYDLTPQEIRMSPDTTERTAPARPGRKIGPGPQGVPGVPPEGYRTIHSKLEPEAVKTARSLLGGEYGTETPFEVNGKRYMARVEPHYGPPGRRNGPVGWHKGVTLYEA